MDFISNPKMDVGELRRVGKRSDSHAASPPNPYIDPIKNQTAVGNIGKVTP